MAAASRMTRRDDIQAEWLASGADQMGRISSVAFSDDARCSDVHGIAGHDEVPRAIAPTATTASITSAVLDRLQALPCGTTRSSLRSSMRHPLTRRESSACERPRRACAERQRGASVERRVPRPGVLRASHEGGHRSRKRCHHPGLHPGTCTRGSPGANRGFDSGTDPPYVPMLAECTTPLLSARLPIRALPAQWPLIESGQDEASSSNPVDARTDGSPRRQCCWSS
jgi:hypothetical protein